MKPDDDDDASTSSNSSEGEQIRISLQASSDCPEDLQLNADSMAVPATIGKQGLTALVQHLLSTKVPLDFWLKQHNSLIRGNLERHVRRCGVSLENAIDIIYAPSLPQPQLCNSTQLPDWIGCLHANSTVIAGLYNGHVSVNQQHFNIHNNSPCKALDVLDNHYVASASLQQSVVVSELQDSSIQALAEIPMAAAPTSVYWTNAILYIGDWQGRLGRVSLQSILTDDTVGEPTKKRKKRTTDAVDWHDAHGGPVSCLGATSSHMVSAGQDHALHWWDGTDRVSTVSVGTAITSLQCQNNKIAVGCANGTIECLSGNPQDQQHQLRLKSAKDHDRIVGVSWLDQDHHVASVVRSGVLQLWDVRSPSLPLHRVRLYDSKHEALCMSVSENVIYVGGTDCRIQEYKL